MIAIFIVKMVVDRVIVHHQDQNLVRNLRNQHVHQNVDRGDYFSSNKYLDMFFLNRSRKRSRSRSSRDRKRRSRSRDHHRRKKDSRSRSRSKERHRRSESSRKEKKSRR